MAPLKLKTATGNYGHTMPLKDGSVTSDAIAFEHVDVPVIINAFRRMIRGLEFDVSEMALSTYLCARAHGIPITAIPIFLVRAFHHGSLIYSTKSGITSPKDLEGRRVGVRGYTVTTGVWPFLFARTKNHRSPRIHKGPHDRLADATARPRHHRDPIVQTKINRAHTS